MAEHETHLWGESFQQEITDVEDIFNIQIRSPNPLPRSSERSYPLKKRSSLKKYRPRILESMINI